MVYRSCGRRDTTEAPEKDTYAVEFYSDTDVLDRLTFQMDRGMVKNAIELVENTYKE